MSQPRLFFQGFEGARKVQSMMIDFPELRFISDKDGLEISSITMETLKSSKFPARCTVSLTVRLLSNRTMYINGLNLSADDTTSKIFVAPESEGFFEPKKGDEFIMDIKPFSIYSHDCCPDLRNGKRIWMPQAVANG